MLIYANGKICTTDGTKGIMTRKYSNFEDNETHYCVEMETSNGEKIVLCDNKTECECISLVHKIANYIRSDEKLLDVDAYFADTLKWVD